MRVGLSPRAIAAGDLDGDRDLDLVVANWGTHNLSILMNNGFGSFANTNTLPVPAGPHTVAAADLDDNGDIDLATTSEWLKSLSVLFNEGEGTFTL